MKSFDVVGWADTENGAAVCLDCTRPGEAEAKDWAAIFAGSEWDSFPTCDRCRQAIYDVGLTTDGVEYHKEWLWTASGTMPSAAADALELTAEPLIEALGHHGVRVETVRAERPGGVVFVMFVPEGYECLPGEHDYDGSGECNTCGAVEED